MVEGGIALAGEGQMCLALLLGRRGRVSHCSHGGVVYTQLAVLPMVFTFSEISVKFTEFQ